MKRFFSHMAFCFGALVILSLSASSAFADGIVLGSIERDKLVPPLAFLNLQHQGHNSTVAGGVSWNGTSDVVTGDYSAGQHAHNFTVPISSLGGSNLSNVGILLNINDSNGRGGSSIIVTSLVLTAYESDGTAHFIGSYSSPDLLNQTRPAQGSQSDWTFVLDPEGQARLRAAMIADPTGLRLGLSAVLDGDHPGGPERFSFAGLNGPPQVPEPTTMVLLGTGLAGIAAKLRKRHKASKEEPPQG